MSEPDAWELLARLLIEHAAIFANDPACHWCGRSRWGPDRGHMTGCVLVRAIVAVEQQQRDALGPVDYSDVEA